MKKFIFLLTITLTVVLVSAQPTVNNRQVSYDAAKWKLWYTDESKLMLSPPPKTEKFKVRNVSPEKLEQAIYWNAGAPSYRWNQIAKQLISWNNVDVVLRTPSSWMNLAVYDATIITWKEKVKYKRTRPTPNKFSNSIVAPLTYSYPCEHSVTAAAAATVLAYFYPAKADSILKLARAASDSRVDAGVQYQSDVDAGWKLGEEVAKQIIEKAKDDGSAKEWKGTINKDPKKWTGPYPLGIKLSIFNPIILKSVDQFRPLPPNDFEQEMHELKNFKKNFASTALAYYWANIGPGFWNDIATSKMFEYRIADDAPAAARIYTVLNVAFHETTIAIMDAKYAYWGIRPSQYDSTYKPLLQTPPFPGYPSGHAAGAATSSTVLKYFFPADAKYFEKLAQDCADSRFYAGIHFKSDNEVGLRLGENVGKYVVQTMVKTP